MQLLKKLLLLLHLGTIAIGIAIAKRPLWTIAIGIAIAKGPPQTIAIAIEPNFHYWLSLNWTLFAVSRRALSFQTKISFCACPFMIPLRYTSSILL